MHNLKRTDRCKDCKNCKVWSSNRNKANCSFGKRTQGFHPDSEIPNDCIGKNPGDWNP